MKIATSGLLWAVLLSLPGMRAGAADSAGETDELCKFVDAKQLSEAMGSEWKTAKGGYGGCTYSNSSRPDIVLVHVTQSTPAERLSHADGTTEKCSDGPAGTLLCSAGFDIRNGKVSFIWFARGEGAYELQYGEGWPQEKAAQIAKLLKP